MRNIFIIGILVVAAFMAGWFTIDRDGDQTTIKINRNEIRGDAKQAIERGREYLDRRKEGQQEGMQYSGSETNSGNPGRESGELRYVQEGGRYNAPTGFQPPPYFPPSNTDQSSKYQYDYPTTPSFR